MCCGRDNTGFETYVGSYPRSPKPFVIEYSARTKVCAI